MGKKIMIQGKGKKWGRGLRERKAVMDVTEGTTLWGSGSGPLGTSRKPSARKKKITSGVQVGENVVK